MCNSKTEWVIVIQCLPLWWTVTKPYTGIWFSITGKVRPPWTPCVCVIHRKKKTLNKRNLWCAKPRNGRGSYTYNEVTGMTQNLSMLRCELTNMWMSRRLDKLSGTSVHRLVKAMDINSPYDLTTAWNKNKLKAVHWSDRNNQAHIFNHDVLDKLLY